MISWKRQEKDSFIYKALSDVIFFMRFAKVQISSLLYICTTYIFYNLENLFLLPLLGKQSSRIQSCHKIFLRSSLKDSYSMILIFCYLHMYFFSSTATYSKNLTSWPPYISSFPWYSSNKIRKAQNEHLNIICQNLNSQ